MSLVCKEVSDLLPRERCQVIPLDDPVIRCKNCGGIITRPSCQIQMDNAFSHAFANPHGHVFVIGCFDDAPGCVAVSPPSSEFSWFKGYEWIVGGCHGCGIHLGWIFRSDLDKFFGLILDKLIIP